jgi:hypothetical protein
METLFLKIQKSKTFKQKVNTDKRSHKPTTTNYSKKIQNILKAKTHIPNRQMPNKLNQLLLLMCGDIERNPSPKFTFLLNHPQDHLEKHKTYFYKNTTQIKIEYIHIFELFKPYLNHTYIENTYPHFKNNFASITNSTHTTTYFSQS